MVVIGWSDIVYGCHIFSCPDKDDDVNKIYRWGDDKYDDESDLPEDGSIRWTVFGIKHHLKKNGIDGLDVIKALPAERFHPDYHPGEYYLSFIHPKTTSELVEFFSSGRDLDKEFVNVLTLLGLPPQKPSLFSIASAAEDH